MREISDADIFVGVYGRRYGSYYIPDDASTEWVLHSFDRAADHFPWVQQYRDRAITEVEFRHGFMRDPGTVCCIMIDDLHCYRDRFDLILMNTKHSLIFYYFFCDVL